MCCDVCCTAAPTAAPTAAVPMLSVDVDVTTGVLYDDCNNTMPSNYDWGQIYNCTSHQCRPICDNCTSSFCEGTSTQVTELSAGNPPPNFLVNGTVSYMNTVVVWNANNSIEVVYTYELAYVACTSVNEVMINVVNFTLPTLECVN